MSVNDCIIYIMVGFMAIAALDRVFGGKLGLGAEFESGINTLGALALCMLGSLCFAPVLADILAPLVAPVFTFLGADPAIFPGCILACDMGAAPLAEKLAQTPEAALFGGVIVGSSLGATVVFAIPTSFGFIKDKDRKDVARGIMAGIITVPAGSFVSGVLAGYPIGFVCRNLLPVVLFSLFIILGLWKFEKVMVKGFIIFGKIVTSIIILAFAAAIFETLTGIVIIPGMAPLNEGFEIIGSIAIVLAGAFPLIYAINRIFKKPLLKLGGLLGMNDVAAAGMIAVLANPIPMFGLLKDMDSRGRILNMAFCVSVSSVIGDHLGFTAGYCPDLLGAVIGGKLVGGITAVAAAMLMTRKDRSAA